MDRLSYRHSLFRSAKLNGLYDMQMDAVVPIENVWASFTTEAHPCNVDETMTIANWDQLEMPMNMPPIWLDPTHHELVLANEQLCPELAAFLRPLGDPERRKVFVYHTRVSNFVSVDQFQGGLQEYLAAVYLANRASPSVSHVIVGIGFSIFEVAVYEHEPSDEPEDVVRARLLNESKKSNGEALDERVRLSYFDSVTNETKTGLTVLDLSRRREDFNRVPLPNAARLPEHPEHSQMLELMPIEQFLANARPNVGLFGEPIWRMDMQKGLDPALHAILRWRVLSRQLLLTNEFRDSTPPQIEESEEEASRKLDDLWSCLPVCSQLGVGLLVDKSQLDAPEPPVKNILVFNRAIEQQQTIEWAFITGAFTDIIEACPQDGFFICTIEYFESYLVDEASRFTKPIVDAFIMKHDEGLYRVLPRAEMLSTDWITRLRSSTLSQGVVTDCIRMPRNNTPLQSDVQTSQQPTANQETEAIQLLCQDLNALRIDEKTRSAENKHPLNLIFFGDTKVGESNLLKLLLNLAAFESFDAAFKGEIKGLRPNGPAKLDQNNNEEVPVDQEVFSCEFRVNDKLHLISIIDTSSLNSNEKVVERIKKLVGRKAICFLLKPNQSGLTSESQDCLKEMLTILRDGTAPQICFCYVNSIEEINVQNEGSTTADAMSSISEIPKELRMEIAPQASNSFCFDEKLFDFLSAKESNHLEESLVDAFKQSWEQSAASFVKLIAHASNQ